VLLGNGDGTFYPPFKIPVGASPLMLATGDFNRDGTPDLAVMNTVDNTVTVLLNQAPRPATHLVVQAAAPVQAGQPDLFTVTALDAQGRTVPGFRGSVTFASSDATSGLPSPYSFTAADAGRHTFVAVFNHPGTWDLIVEDVAAPALDNGVAVTVQSPSAAGTDVTTEVKLVNGHFRHRGRRWQQVVTLTNLDSQPLAGPLQVVVANLTRRARLSLPSGFTPDRSPYRTVDLGPDGSLNPGQTLTVTLVFRSSSRPAYTLRVLAG
jgi:hypothetical protein